MRPELSAGARVAVVGAGVAGITCAHLLQRRYCVTLIDAAPRLGGHANPVAARLPSGEVMADTGFLVFNLRTYPDFLRLLSELGVDDAIQHTDMRFSLSSAPLRLAFSDRDFTALTDGGRNLLRPRALALMVEFARLRRRAWRDLHSGRGLEGTVGEYCARYHPVLLEGLIKPLGSAIWTLPGAEVARYPAEAFFRFFDNHGLLKGASGRQWRTLKGSSAVYINAFRAQFQGDLRLGAPVSAIHRAPGGVQISFEGGGRLKADAVILATHADTAQKLLADPTRDEARLLGPWRYHPSQAVLHTDPSFMPPHRRQWASWNVVVDDAGPVVTYDLKRVQGLSGPSPLFLSLTEREVGASHVLGRFDYQHPIFDAPALAAQAPLRALSGARRTHFAGSYFGYGFHQDAVASALEACAELGVGWEG